eukprot:TRINITY_DN4198_c0_g1_i1.p1 TRINITY_DN4198_c0_g1~~TRINITY_DN4198_c0_g1_i1.p1  ORF type:complete len:689 (-),score=174.37 TRINITY_DN4198_c0_g1_i1:43-2109(-)
MPKSRQGDPPSERSTLLGSDGKAEIINEDVEGSEKEEIQLDATEDVLLSTEKQEPQSFRSLRSLRPVKWAEDRGLFRRFANWFVTWFIPRLIYYVPILEWIRSYTFSSFLSDLIAGMSVGVMLVPQGLAYASLARVKPIYGLYACFTPLLVYVVFGNSRQLAIGPEAMIALLTGTNAVSLLTQTSRDVNEDQVVILVLMLSFMVGCLNLLMGIFRFGFLDNILSKPILRGFITAVAILIASEQIDIFFGFDLPDYHGYAKIPYIFNHSAEIQPIALVMGILSVIFLYGVGLLKQKTKNKSFWRWLTYIPEILVVVLLGISITALAGLHKKGLEILGTFSGGLPIPQIPEFDLNDMSLLFQPAIIISIVGFVESIIVARVYATKHNYSVSANRELVALGLANIIGSCFGAWPCFGSMARSAVNDRAGAKTPMAGLFAALIVMVAILFLLPVFQMLPKVTMASIIMVAALALIETEEIRFLIKIRAIKDLVLTALTLLVTVILGVEVGLTTAIILSLFFIVKQSTMPTVTLRSRIPDTEQFHDLKVFKDINIFDEKKDWFYKTVDQKGFMILRIEDSLYFANISSLKALLRKLEQASQTPLSAVVLELKNVTNFDTSALQVLKEIVEEYHERHVSVCLVKLKPENQRLFFSSGILDLVGTDHVFSKTNDAISFLEGTLTGPYSSYHHMIV